MKFRTPLIPVMLAALACAPAFAAAPARPPVATRAPTAQQQRMATCAAQNKGRKGADYKAAQAACLKQTAAAPATAKATSQQRMAACAAQNKGKKGADYKAAQSACLKKS